MAVGLLAVGQYGHTDTLLELLPPSHYLALHDRTQPGWKLSWASTYETSFRVGSDPLMVYAGREIDTFSLALNTAMVVGSDQIRLLARLHGQCELHGWIDGPNRAWLADIIQGGLDTGLYRKGYWHGGAADIERRWVSQGWEDVIELLRSRDDEPVVMSYSVCDGFPNQEIAQWSPPEDADLTPDWARDAPDEWNALSEDEQEDHRIGQADELWCELPRHEQWKAAMAGLRARRGKLEMRTNDWVNYRFDHRLSVIDLLGHDWRERVEAALGIERQDA
jgi:hypothetical protein